ncbi:hypothetical protein AAZX31_19G067900 [Glycine max]
MSFLSWNYRELGNPYVIPILHDLVQTEHLDFIFLSRTLVGSGRMEEIRNQLSFDSCFAIDPIGRSGGLAKLRRNPFDWQLINFSSNFISVKVHREGKPVWCLTGFYAIEEKLDLALATTRWFDMFTSSPAFQCDLI